MTDDQGARGAQPLLNARRSWQCSNDDSIGGMSFFKNLLASRDPQLA